MGQINILVGGRHYPIACGDGEEEQVRRLADIVNRKADELTGTLGPMGEGRLLLMTALMLADELAEARQQANSDPSTLAGAEQAVQAAAARLAALADGLEPLPISA